MNLCATLILCGLLLLDGGPPPGDGLEELSDEEVDRLSEALEANLGTWMSGQEVEPFKVEINLTTYWPPDGGINCNGDCEHLGASSVGVPAEEWFRDGAACPPDVPRGSKITFQPRFWITPVTVVCKDGGGAIGIQSDGSIDVDWMIDEPVWNATYPAFLEFPDHKYVCPAENGCDLPVYVPYRLAPPSASEIDLPVGECPIWSCDPWYVKVQGLGGATDATRHWGVDLWTGQDGEVGAPWDATVIFAGEYKLYGDMTALDYGNGYWSRLGHCKPLVSVGEQVDAGQAVCQVGDTGYTLDGQHVHFELWWYWTPYDVLSVLEAQGHEEIAMMEQFFDWGPAPQYPEGYAW